MGEEFEVIEMGGASSSKRRAYVRARGGLATVYLVWLGHQNYRIWLFQVCFVPRSLCLSSASPPIFIVDCNPDNADTGMELPATSSHQFNMRKTGEPGLAEWAQKIRALQRQVDEDEEEEHRKLEQEIAASRLARVRRSAAYGNTPFDPGAGMPSPSLVAGLYEN